mgnify:FL=1
MSAPCWRPPRAHNNGLSRRSRDWGRCGSPDHDASPVSFSPTVCFSAGCPQCRHRSAPRTSDTDGPLDLTSYRLLEADGRDGEAEAVRGRIRGEGCVGGAEGRADSSRVGRAVQSLPDTGSPVEEGASGGRVGRVREGCHEQGVRGRYAETGRELHAKIGKRTVADDFFVTKAQDLRRDVKRGMVEKSSAARVARSGFSAEC